VKRIVLFAFALSFSLSVSGVALGQRKAVDFGALEALNAEAAQGKVTAWLKDVGKSDAATQGALAAIWKQSERSILDRVADSLALGDPVAAKLLADARDPNAPAPIVLPAVFKNASQAAFFRANLGLIYARALTNRRVYEEALDTLKLFGAEQTADPAAYLFHRAVCEHAMLRKPEATKSIVRLLEEGEAISPERYKTVATLMLLDMHTWKDKDLGDIARKMDNVERRLDIARGGPETQKQQREILNRLDEMIKKLENQNKKKPGQPGDGSGDQGGQCPDGSSGGPPNGANPSSNPATDSANVNASSTGVVDTAKFKKLVSDWGRLPPREQQQALQQLTQGMNPSHRTAIENYFRNLSNPALNRK
jgi:hypothetical protein